MIKLA